MGIFTQNNFINSFSERVANSGYQRSNRFIVYIKGPSVNFIKNKPKKNVINSLSDSILKTIGLEESPKSINKFLAHDDVKRLAVSVNGVSLPGKSLSTTEFGPVGSGTINRYPYQETYTNEIAIDFNCGLDFYERNYFQAWMNTIIDPVTHDIEIADNYAKDYKIFIIMLPVDITNFEKLTKLISENPLNSAYSENGNFERSLFFIRLNNVYPFEIQESQLTYDTPNQIQKVSVKFNYNFTDDPVTIAMTNRTISPSDVDFGEESPFSKFKRIVREGVKYATDPKALRQAIIEEGLDIANDYIGIQNVESIAQGGEIVDVFSRTKNIKDLGILKNI